MSDATKKPYLILITLSMMTAITGGVIWLMQTQGFGIGPSMILVGIGSIFIFSLLRYNWVTA